MKKKVFKMVKKYFAFLNLSDKELMKMVDKTFDESKNEDENFNKILSVFFAVVKESYKNGDISLILSSNKFYYDDFLKAVDSLNDFALFLQKCDIKFDSELESKIMECTLDLDKTLEKITEDGGSYINNLNKAAVNLINNSSHSFNVSEGEKLLEYEYLLEEEECDEEEITDDYYNRIINEFSYTDDSTKQYFREVMKIPRLTEEEEKVLYKEYRETKNPKIRKRIIEGNLRLVISIAAKYNGKAKGFTLLDLISVGNEGLFRALDDYDPEKARFSTYATEWIRQKILREIQNDCAPFRIPANLKQKIFKFRQNKSDLEMQYGRKLLMEELSEKTGLSAEKIKHYEKLLLQLNGVSMDMPVGEEEDTKLIEFIEDSEGMNPEEAAIFNDMTNVDYLLSKLSEVEKMVVSLRTGLYDGRCYSFDEVSDKLHELGLKDTVLSRQRMEQLESRALKKLRKKIEIIKKRSNIEDIVINRTNEKNVSSEEFNKISTEFLKLVKLIKITEVAVLSKSVAELPDSHIKVLRTCFGKNIFSGSPLAPSIDVKKDAAYVVLPELRKIIIKNERIKEEIENENFDFPRNLYKYYFENTRYDVDKAIEELSASDRLYLSKCYDFYTGDFIFGNTANYHDKKCILMVLKNIEFNLPKRKVKRKVSN